MVPLELPISENDSQGHYPSAHFRGSKADLWDGGHRVPFIVRWPGVTKASSESNQLICFSDLMATFTDLFSIELPDNAAEDSWSFLPALSGKSIQNPRENIVHHSLFGRFSVREGDWKLILAPGSGGWSAPNDIVATEKGLPEVQLYNLQKDIGEQNNLISSNPEKIEALTALLQDLVSKGRSTPGLMQKNDAEIDIFKLPLTPTTKVNISEKNCLHSE